MLPNALLRNGACEVEIEVRLKAIRVWLQVLVKALIQFNRSLIRFYQIGIYHITSPLLLPPPHYLPIRIRWCAILRLVKIDIADKLNSGGSFTKKGGRLSVYSNKIPEHILNLRKTHYFQRNVQ